MENTEKKKLPSSTKNSLACGYMGLFFWIIPTLGSFVGIVGIMFGVKGYKLKKKKLAYLSISLCSVAIVLSLLNGIFRIFTFTIHDFGLKFGRYASEKEIKTYTNKKDGYSIQYPATFVEYPIEGTSFHAVNQEKVIKNVLTENIEIKIIRNVDNAENYIKEGLKIAESFTDNSKINIIKKDNITTKTNLIMHYLITSYKKNNTHIKVLQGIYYKDKKIYRISIAAEPNHFNKNKQKYIKILQSFSVIK